RRVGLDGGIGQIADHRTIGDLPYLDDALQSARSGGEQLAIGAEGGAEDAVLVSLLEFLDLARLELANEVPRRNVPKFQALIVASGNDLLAVRGEGQCVDHVGVGRRMGVDFLDESVFDEIENADFAVVTTRDKQISARLENHRI